MRYELTGPEHGELAVLAPGLTVPLFRRTQTLGVATMLSWESDDHVTPIDCVDTARVLLRPQCCHIVDPCGQMASLERPREVADKIASFVAGRVEKFDS